MEVVPACEYYGLGIIPWSPLASGALSGSGRRGNAEQSRRNSDWAKSSVAGHEAQIEKYEALCGKIGQEPADVALAWLLSRPAVTAPIVGPRTVEQLESSVRVAELKLDTETLIALDAIFPPYKTAPEHYAW
jgi:aryl-alcohol dehydrogenase-like predicted oxidoreductase